MNSFLQSILPAGQWLAFGIVGVCAGYLVFKRSEEPWKILIKAAVTVPLIYYSFHFARAMGPNGLFVVMIGALAVGIIWTPHIGELVAGPFMGLFDGGNEAPEKRPLYSTAQAKRKKGHWQAAIEEVHRQLLVCPGDFEGIMLIASIEAENLYDLTAAAKTLEEFCNRPETSAKHATSALITLADWHLQINADVELAEMALRRILARNPDTEFARLAGQRLAHLAGARETMEKRSHLDGIIVPAGIENPGLRDSPAVQPAEESSEATARGYLIHLQQHPRDIEVREKLALVYARDFKRLDLATLELEQLIGQDGCSARQISGWLNLLATLQIESGESLEMPRATLEKIPERFPDTSFAETARRRMELLNNEIRGRKENATIKLGTYEQNIGLKYGRGQRYQ